MQSQDRCRGQVTRQQQQIKIADDYLLANPPRSADSYEKLSVQYLRPAAAFCRAVVSILGAGTPGRRHKRIFWYEITKKKQHYFLFFSNLCDNPNSKKDLIIMYLCKYMYILNFMPATRFKTVGTWKAKECSKNTCLQHSTGKQVHLYGDVPAYLSKTMSTTFCKCNNSSVASQQKSVGTGLACLQSRPVSHENVWCIMKNSTFKT